jgi:hypothetical protein
MIILAVISLFGALFLQDQWNAAAIKNEQVFASLIRMNQAAISRAVHQLADHNIGSWSELKKVSKLFRRFKRRNRGLRRRESGSCSARVEWAELQFSGFETLWSG